MLNFKKIFSSKEKQLPLLSFVSEKYPNIDLSRTLVIACQHILGTTFNLFDELFKKGLKPENTYLLGKCYSTNEKTFQKFSDKKVNISNQSKFFDSHISFDEQFQSNVGNFLREISNNVNIKNFQKVIVLDDGGALILYVNDFFNDLKNFVGVEQTSSGYEKLKDVQLSFPVVNIARSKAKLEHESPMVARLVVDKVKLYFKEHAIKDPKILVIGQGYIGEAITGIFKADHQVNSCDKLSSKCDFSGRYKAKFGDFDVIIGTTGQSSIVAGDFGKLKKGAVLISASSSDREFSAVYLRSLQAKTNNCHQDFSINDITLVNGGFPINFDGREHSLTPEKIQLTRALLLAGVLEAVDSKGYGLVDLDDKIQNQITEKFYSLIHN